LPGEWYGPHAIAIILKDLNKMFQPFDDFKLCVFHDASIYFSKLERLGTQRSTLSRTQKAEPTCQLKRDQIAKMEFIFD